MELDAYTDEPEFIALFDFLIGVGTGDNTYIDGLLEFGSQFVDAKLRQLRLVVFLEAGNIDQSCPPNEDRCLEKSVPKETNVWYLSKPRKQMGEV